jgi:hypothetical protein
MADGETRSLGGYALALFLGGFIVPILVIIVAGAARAPVTVPIAATVLLLLSEIAAGILGIVSWRDPRGKAAALGALVLALLWVVVFVAKVSTVAPAAMPS